ncbi:hypothetical protein [Mesorhizobium sp. M0898]
MGLMQIMPAIWEELPIK